METKHTGGEWRTFYQDDDIFIETEGRVNAIASIPGGVGDEEDEANAKLIKASPKMLEALDFLILAKERKETIGKDKAYESLREEGWIRAYAALKLATE